MTKNYTLIKARKEAGLTQVQLAEKLQVDQSFISALENGKVFLQYTANELGKALSIDPKTLLADLNGDFIKVDPNTAKNNVLAFLKRRGVSITDLIEKLGISRSTFYYQVQSNPIKQSFIEAFNKETNNNLISIINQNQF